MIAHAAPRADERRPRPLRIALLVAGLALATLLLVLEAPVLMVLLAGALFALALHGTSAALARRTHVRYGVVLVAVIVLVVGGVAFGTYALGAGLARQAQDLGHRLPEAWHSLLASLHSDPVLGPLTERLRRAPPLAPEKADIAAGASGVVEAIGAVIVVFFVGVYGAAQPEAYANVIARIVPRRRRRRARAAMARMGEELTRWLAGRAVAMAVVGVLVTTGLLLLRVPLAWTLGALAAVLTFVEYLGAFASAAPAMLVALSRGPQYALWVALLFTAAHVLEGYVLTPLLVRTTVRLPPAYTLATQTVLGAIYGVAGLTFATPILIVGTVLVRALYLAPRDARERRGARRRSGSPARVRSLLLEPAGHGRDDRSTPA